MQVPATVVTGNADADDGLDGVGLGVATAAGELPGLAVAVALAAASGAGIEVGAGLQVLTRVVTGTGFDVGTTLPIGAAVPPVDSAGLADGTAEVDDWFPVVVGARLGFTGVDRLGGAMLLWLGVSGPGVDAAVGVGVGVTVCARSIPPAVKNDAMVHSLLICPDPFLCE